MIPENLNLTLEEAKHLYQLLFFTAIDGKEEMIVKLQNYIAEYDVEFLTNCIDELNKEHNL